jgi:hypothetical protein
MKKLWNKIITFERGGDLGAAEERRDKRSRGQGCGPDPAFFLIADPDPGFDYLKLKKFTAGNLIVIFLIKNCN